jgi:hypothetical protein
MLTAILNGKSRRIPHDVRPGDSWRDVFRVSEDLLTAAVLTRLCYLDGSLFWQILQRSVAPSLLPIRTVAQLREFRFWPRWGEAREKLKQDVVADALLRFKIGDPAQQATLIIEAKLRDVQRADQWALEWIAYNREQDTVGSGELEEVYLVALGGLNGRRAERVQKLTDEANRIIASKNEPRRLVAVGADWADLATTIYEVTRQVDQPNQRILRDITEALALAGYRYALPLAGLPKESAYLRPREHSMQVLADWGASLS